MVWYGLGGVKGVQGVRGGVLHVVTGFEGGLDLVVVLEGGLEGGPAVGISCGWLIGPAGTDLLCSWRLPAQGGSLSAPRRRGVRRWPCLDDSSSVCLFVWQYGSILPNRGPHPTPLLSAKMKNNCQASLPPQNIRNWLNLNFYFVAIQ